MKTVSIISIAFLSLVFLACKKSDTPAPDVKSNFLGNWAGSQQVTGVSFPYKFSLQINSNNTVVNIDSAFSNEVFLGTYTYTSDSLIISYSNGTVWRMKFLTNYSSSTGLLFGARGATGTITMSKK